MFDSGVGGLSVLRQINYLLPTESVIYFGDTLHVPYGGRPLEEVRGFALNICRFLVKRGVKMIVMACNISSAVAIDLARIEFPDIPIIGVIEPGATAAISTGARRIGVLATQGTVTSGAYTRVVQGISATASVSEIACPLFVPIVEAELVGTAEALMSSIEYLAPLAEARCRAIILGCTHYPFLLDTLVSASKDLFPLDEQPIFVDPAVATAKAVREILTHHQIQCERKSPGGRDYLVSGLPDQFNKNGSFFLNQPIVGTQRAELP